VDLRFNISHSQETALYAFSIGMELGIDVETVRPVEDADQIVQRYFSAEEKLIYAALDQPEEEQLVFFQCWTRKEAFLKATGEGLALELDQVVVSLGLKKPAQLLSIPARYQPISDWQLVNLELGPDCCAALAVRGAAQRISYWQWNEQVEQ
jgi:4'-phosphopantetheinyl transferase